MGFVCGVLLIVMTISFRDEDTPIYTMLIVGVLLVLPFLSSLFTMITGIHILPASDKPSSQFIRVLNGLLLVLGGWILGVGIDTYLQEENYAITMILVGSILLGIDIVLVLIVNIKRWRKEHPIHEYSYKRTILPEKEVRQVTSESAVNAVSVSGQTVTEVNPVPLMSVQEKKDISDLDPLFDEVANLVVATQQGSTSMIQRKFSIGYNRAGLLMDELEMAGIIGKAVGSKPREVLCPDIQQLNLILQRIDRSNAYVTDTVSIPDSLFKDIISNVNKLFAYLQSTSKNAKAMDAIDIPVLKQCVDLGFSIDSRLAAIALHDVIVCYKNLGYDINVNRRENMALTIFVIKLIMKSGEPVLTQKKLMGQYRTMINNFLKTFEETFKWPMSDDTLLLSETFKQGGVDKRVTSRYLTLIYELSSTLAKVDGKISFEESSFMSKILKDIGELSARRVKTKDEINATVEEKVESHIQGKSKSLKAEKELKKLIGLESVKEEVTRMTNFVKVQQMRKAKGMAASPISYHCVFTGNPGTGKTTVARLLAAIYKDLGVLSEGHLIETDRSGLVAEYVGQTAIKTNKIIDSAIGGVLFIDEAYALVKGDNNDFGMEAISTLLKRMEDDRDKLVVILAGYGDEMKTFIDSNPGLQSRFNRYIHFPDYSASDLMDISKLDIKKLDYELAEEAATALRELFESAVQHKDKNFGNGRFARNIVEKILENQATRLSSKSDISDEDLRMIIVSDIPNYAHKE